LLSEVNLCIFLAAVWDRQSQNEITSQVLATKAWHQSGMHNQAKLESTTVGNEDIINRHNLPNSF
jgi:hypothetical protein